MLKHIIFVCIIMVCGVEMFSVINKLITTGKWKVENIEKCENPEQYEYEFTIKRKKLNRTHDGFDIDLNFPTEINKSDFGYYVEACIKVDGGCRLVQIIKGPSLCDSLNEYAEDNFKKILAIAGLEQDCPIPAGRHIANGIMIDNNEFPEHGLFGRFQSTAYLRNSGGENVACLILDSIFEELQNED